MASSPRNVISDHFQALHTFTFKGVLSLVHPCNSKNVPPYHIKSEKSNCELLSCPTLCNPMDCSPPRLLCLWNSPGKNTGVGCHFLLQCRKVKSESEVAQSCPTLSNSMDCSPQGSTIHGIFQARVLELGAIAFSPSIT